MTTPLRLGIAGLGTVGAGVVRLLRENGAIMAPRAGREIAVSAVSARRRERDLDLASAAWCDDALELARRDDVDVVVEVIGGEDGIALALVEAAIAAGKPVVTANKALLAVHGARIARAADAAGVHIGFEAAVAGGIPVVKALREGLAANDIRALYGILNGTSNYILTEMRERGGALDAVLTQAQRLGYAEADPTLDIGGGDAAHKLALLAGLAFGRATDLDAVHVEGIAGVTPMDIAFARELGYRIKPLAMARAGAHGIEQRVHPAMVPIDRMIAHVDGVDNAVVVEADATGTTTYVGRGAGAGPTASAVIADVIDLARGRRLPLLPAARREPGAASSPGVARRHGAYYLRLMVIDRPGVIAEVAAILRDRRISIESMLQRGRAPDATVPVVLTTHETGEEAMTAAIEDIAELEAVVEPPQRLRIERL